MNRLFLLVAFSFWGILCWSQLPVPPKVQKIVEEFTTDECFYSAGIGIAISDVESGKRLGANQANLGLIPASCQKLITTATALEILGKDYRFKTSVETDGKLLENGMLNGNLIIKGFGDPTLGSKYFVSEASQPCSFIADNLKKQNINKIQGKIIADASYISASIPHTWIWEDIGNYYGGIPNGLSYVDNTYTLYFESEKAGNLTHILRTIPATTGLEFENLVVSSETKRDLAYIFGGNTSNKRRIEGSIPQNQKEFAVKGALSNPEIPLIHDLQRSLSANNIKVENQSLPLGIRKILFSLDSPPMSDIIFETNQNSINLFADHLLFELGQKQESIANWESGANAIKNYWKQKGFNTDYISLYDGSGLSHFNSVSADFFDQILQFMYHSGSSKEFIASLPISGKTGTLQYFGKSTPVESNWKAKTGSMTGIKSFCGYLSTKKGRTLSVSILINNYHCSSSTLNQKVLNFLIQLYNS